MGQFKTKEEAVLIRKAFEKKNFIISYNELHKLDMNKKEDLEKLFYYKEGFLYSKLNRRSVKKDQIIKGYYIQGYPNIKILSKRYPLHRLIWVYHNGSIPEGMQIDHINHIRDDNRIENLRLVTQRENLRNLSLRINNSSGVTGIHFSKSKNKWEAEIQVNANRFYLGSFKEKEDAIKARKEAEIKYGFHPNHGKDLSE